MDYNSKRIQDNPCAKLFSYKTTTQPTYIGSILTDDNSIGYKLIHKTNRGINTNNCQTTLTPRNTKVG